MGWAPNCRPGVELWDLIPLQADRCCEMPVPMEYGTLPRRAATLPYRPTRLLCMGGPFRVLGGNWADVDVSLCIVGASAPPASHVRRRPRDGHGTVVPTDAHGACTAGSANVPLRNVARDVAGIAVIPASWRRPAPTSTRGGRLGWRYWPEPGSSLAAQRA
jgi:hypothetical protein